VSAIRIVRPETLIRWHRRGFKASWPWKSCPGVGRPPIDREIRDLIRQMSMANQLFRGFRIELGFGMLAINFELRERQRARRIRCASGSVRQLPPAVFPPRPYPVTVTALGVAGSSIQVAFRMAASRVSLLTFFCKKSSSCLIWNALSAIEPQLWPGRRPRQQ
jgi:hypothetical protein